MYVRARVSVRASVWCMRMSVQAYVCVCVCACACACACTLGPYEVHESMEGGSLTMTMMTIMVMMFVAVDADDA